MTSRRVATRGTVQKFIIPTRYAISVDRKTLMKIISSSHTELLNTYLYK
jgi:hypothetical protein